MKKTHKQIRNRIKANIRKLDKQFNHLSEICNQNPTIVNLGQVELTAGALGAYRGILKYIEGE